MSHTDSCQEEPEIPESVSLSQDDIEQVNGDRAVEDPQEPTDTVPLQHDVVEAVERLENGNKKDEGKAETEEDGELGGSVAGNDDDDGSCSGDSGDNDDDDDDTPRRAFVRSLAPSPETHLGRGTEGEEDTLFVSERQ